MWNVPFSLCGFHIFGARLLLVWMPVASFLSAFLSVIHLIGVCRCGGWCLLLECSVETHVCPWRLRWQWWLATSPRAHVGGILLPESMPREKGSNGGSHPSPSAHPNNGVWPLKWAWASSGYIIRCGHTRL